MMALIIVFNVCVFFAGAAVGAILMVQGQESRERRRVLILLDHWVTTTRCLQGHCDHETTDKCADALYALTPSSRHLPRRGR